MLERILMFCLIAAANPLAAGFIHTAASGSGGPVDLTARATITNAPMSSNIASIVDTGHVWVGGSFDLTFPAIAVPAGNTLTQLVLWVIGNYATSSASQTATPVVAECSDGPCPFQPFYSGSGPGGPYGWVTVISLPGIQYFSSLLRAPYAFLDVSHNTEVLSAVESGTPLILHVGWSVEYEGYGELILSTGFNAITQQTYHASGSPGLWASLELYSDPAPATVPEPGTGALFSLAFACVACRLTRRRYRDTANR